MEKRPVIRAGYFVYTKCHFRGKRKFRKERTLIWYTLAGVMGKVSGIQPPKAKALLKKQRYGLVLSIFDF